MRNRKRSSRFVRPAVLFSVASFVAAVFDPVSAMAQPATPVIHVAGNQLIGATGKPIDLVGLNRSGTEYACAQGWGIFDGATGPALIAQMKSLPINAVRVPLNEDCWLGINVPSTFSGAIYRAAIANFISELSAAGLVAILDLHWSAPGAHPALGQQAMPDSSHGIAFWTSVAQTFRSNAGVAFELFNEPHSVSWRCWLNGCEMPGGWHAIGMQALVSSVRSTGAQQPIILDGLSYANDLQDWMKFEPKDPLHQLAAGFHVYSFNSCASVSCWNATVKTVARHVPVVTTEFGEEDCKGTFVDRYAKWATTNKVSLVAWTWNDNESCLSIVAHQPAGNAETSLTAYGTAVRSAYLRMVKIDAGEKRD